MRGYLRRKITYNMGNTRGKESPQSPIGNTKRKGSFFLKGTGGARAFIFDNGVLYPIDEEYRALGVKEGWLTLFRFARAPDGILELKYIHNP